MKAMAKTVFTLARSQSIRGEEFPAGYPVAEITHPANVPAAHVIEMLRSNPNLDVRVSSAPVAGATEEDPSGDEGLAGIGAGDDTNETKRPQPRATRR